MDVLGRPQPQTRVPAGAVQDEHELFVWPGSRLPGKRGEFHLEERDADAGRQMEEGSARGGMHKADQIAPFEAVAHRSERSLPDRRPDPTQERLEANAMLVHRPQLDLRLREGGRHRAHQRPQLFLKVSCSWASANTCRGRGACRLCLRRTR